ncbi:hypothetical protein [Alteromonas aestuariivivens]|uniref:hypothetical protein n=1 Tax=Alteromonas aestuariivivens TaxID=1938339 RepID=UPI0011C065A3|nr:hypothetical protein [Alteromonas aestuariivivens]
MNNLYKNVAGRIEDLILAIVALGILVVSIEYIQFYLYHRELNLDTHGFIQRIVLFLVVILFTSYYFLAYSAYFSHNDTDDNLSNLCSLRLITMYILDLIQVTLAALPYAILLIGTLSSAPDQFNSWKPGEFIALKISLNQMHLLFVIMMCWHLVVYAWYMVASGDQSSKRLHLGYTACYVLLAMQSAYAPQWAEKSPFFVWGLIGVYMLLVLSLYLSKGKQDVQRAIDFGKHAA